MLTKPLAQLPEEQLNNNKRCFEISMLILLASILDVKQ